MSAKGIHPLFHDYLKAIPYLDRAGFLDPSALRARDQWEAAGCPLYEEPCHVSISGVKESESNLDAALRRVGELEKDLAHATNRALGAERRVNELEPTLLRTGPLLLQTEKAARNAGLELAAEIVLKAARVGLGEEGLGVLEGLRALAGRIRAEKRP